VNGLFVTFQVITAESVGVSPTLIAAANSSGGTLGKMISLQTIAIAAVQEVILRCSKRSFSLYLTAQRDTSCSRRADCLAYTYVFHLT
jgi:lactate permease